LVLVSAFLPDPRADGFDNNATVLGFSGSRFDEVAALAEQVASVVTSAEELPRLAPCAAAESPVACARRFIAGFGVRAWGRPLADDELARLEVVFRAGADGDSYTAGIRMTVEALVQSPHFLYRTELGPGLPVAGAVRVTLTSHEVASQLAFLVAGSRPDLELLAAASAGRLLDAEERGRQVRRLLKLPAARARLRGFLKAWLGLDHIKQVSKDLFYYPEATPDLLVAMDRETDTFVDHVLAQDGGALGELFLAEYTFPGKVLASVYRDDLRGTPGDFVKVALDSTRRRGILSSPTFLASHAALETTSPVQRGLLVRSRMFCQEVSPPPPGTATDPPRGMDMLITTREKYRRHADDPTCRACHQLMDPIGFGFEEFDAIGRRRLHEYGTVVDGSGELKLTDIDGAFRGPAELALRLVQSRMFWDCVAAQLFRFGEGRAPGGADAGEVGAVGVALAPGTRRLEDAVVGYVQRPNFVRRLAADAPAEAAP
jgi:hypothetical protein